MDSDAPVPLAASAMTGARPWQLRMREAGLTQRALARLIGRPENTVSRQLRGEFGEEPPAYVRSAIIAWELMTAEQRAAWVAAMAQPGPTAWTE